MSKGLILHITPESARISVACDHQSIVIYAVPGERSWVCTPDLLPVHALAGFFKELVALRDPKVIALMQAWGLYARELLLEVKE